MSRGRYHREKNMTSFFCLRIPFSVRARPVLTLESILINYSPIFFLCCYSRWLQLEYGAFLLVPSEERWAHTMNGFCSSRDQPWAELLRFRHTWILYVCGLLAMRLWASHFSSLSFRILLYQIHMTKPPSQSAVMLTEIKYVYTWSRQFEVHQRNFKMLCSLLLLPC